MSYIGNEPVVSATRTVTEITATAGQTVFNANGGYTVGYIDVFVNGAQLQSSDFTATNGTSITLNSGALAGDDIRLVAWGTFSVGALPGTGVTPGTYGSSSAVPVVTVGADGRVTSATTAALSGGGQFFGSAAVKAIAYNSATIAENVTVTAGNNGLSAGPITINNGFTVTVESGATWVIV